MALSAREAGEGLAEHPAALVVADTDGTIVFWNAAAEALLGYSQSDAVGQSLESLLVPDDRRAERGEVLGQATEGGAACYTTERKHKNGDTVPVSVTIDVVRAEGQHNGYAYITMRELSKLRCMCGATVSNAPARPMKELTTRQRQVLRLIAEGRSTREIAQRLTLSVKTVETHRGHLMQRLRLKSVAGLVRYAVSIGLVPPSPWAVKTSPVGETA